MIKVAIYQDRPGEAGISFRAVTARNQAVGRTAGEALDALTNQLPDQEAATLIIVRNLGPDRFFTSEQCERLEQLMAQSRYPREAGETLSADEQAELEHLVDAEIRGAGERAAASMLSSEGRVSASVASLQTGCLSHVVDETDRG